MPNHPSLDPARPFLACLSLLFLMATVVGCGTKAPPSETAVAGTFSKRFETVTVNGLNLRSQPAPKANSLAVLAKGEQVQTISRSGNWIRVKTKTNVEGYVYGAFLTGFDIPAPQAKSGQGKGGETGGSSLDSEAPMAVE